MECLNFAVSADRPEDVLQHRQEGRRLHVGDADLSLVLGQFSVEHGVEHRAAHRQDVLRNTGVTRTTLHNNNQNQNCPAGPDLKNLPASEESVPHHF